MKTLFSYRPLRSSTLALAPSGRRRRVARALAVPPRNDGVQNAIVVLPSGWRLRVARALVQNAIVVLLVALLWLALSHALPAQAATPYVITSCTEPELLNAMNYMNNNLITDGIISFNCKNLNAAATISITWPGGYIVANGAAYTIDGGNVIVLTGLGATRLLQVQANGALTLTNIILTSGNAGAGYGGCLYNRGGILRLDNVTVQDCRTDPGYRGGAINNDDGTLTIIRSFILGGRSTSGGGIENVGSLTVISSVIAYNNATDGLGGGLDVGVSGIDVAGRVTISNSTFYLNRATNGNGGGINAWSATSVTVHNSLMFYNVATGTVNGNGGGIYSQGALALTDSTLSGNWARTSGGAMYLVGAAILKNATLSGNQATFGGGILNGDSLVLNNATLSGNTAVTGGGIYNLGTATLTNVTLSGNSAAAYGGGIHNQGSALTLNNGTLSGNSALTGGGIQNVNAATLKNTIIANSPSGQNCGGSVFTSNDYNLSTDDSCVGSFNKTHDWNTALANLGPLTNNGGPSTGSGQGPALTHIPFPLASPGNKAIDGGNGCPATDQRGVSRPQGALCDIGAVEYVPGEKSPWLYLPLLRR